MEQQEQTKQSSFKKKKRSNALLSGLIGGSIGASVVCALFLAYNPPANTTATTQTTVTQQKSTSGTTGVSTAALTANDSDVTKAVTNVEDAVVSVVNYQRSSASGGSFNWLQNNQENDSLKKAGEGSGVIYKSEAGEAYIVTNNHVIQNADEVNVILKDGTTVKVEIVGTDSLTDLAVLKIKNNDVKKVATFADSSGVKVGQTALAIGSPLGSKYASTVTKGIISAVNRSVEVDTNNDNQPDWSMKTLQTDAAINPGNSGGALVDLNGHVIGINSMKIASTSVEGIGFAIPSNQVVSIINQLEKNGKVTRPQLGISMVDLSSVSASQQSALLGLPENVKQGVVISSVQPGSSAEKSGLQAYDVITSWEGKPVTDAMTLRQYLYEHKNGDTLTLEVYRKGKLEKIKVTLTQ